VAVALVEGWRGEICHVAVATVENEESAVPEWLSVNNEHLTAKGLRLPEPGEVRLPFEIDMAKVIELYTR
jgi:ribosomal protein S4